MIKYSHIALGSNATSSSESPKEIILHAMRAICERVGDISESSKIYRTACFPKGAGPDYANAVIRVETTLGASDILSGLHRIEHDFGRVRTVRWGQRSLDLDLLSIGGLVLPDRDTVTDWIDLPIERQMEEAPDQLLLPHPRIQDRAFVLVPLAEIDPDWQHPLSGKTALQMRDALPQADLDEVAVWE